MKEAVLDSIKKHIEKEQTAAYLELICTEILGEFIEVNEKEILQIIKDLERENLIVMNGDRILLNTEELTPIVIYDLEEYDLPKEVDEMKLRSIDVGHGCNMGMILGEILEHAPEIVEAGLICLEYKANYEVGKYLLGKINEVKGYLEQKYKESKLKYYLSEPLIDNVVITKILKELNLKFEDVDIEVNFKHKQKIGSVGYYQIQNQGVAENSLQGSPESIYYYMFSVTSKKLPSDDEIITCEILSNGNIRYFNRLSVSTGCNFNSY
ncbi:MAG: hypothetical protein ACRCWG_10315 [Sarcina sp.]